MASSPLTNYLRANRKRLALSQEDVAYLLGGESGEKVCRHERFVREPSLRTVIAYEIIYGKPARELLAGLYQEIQEEVATRARDLAMASAQQRPSRQTHHRQQSLADIASRLLEEPLNSQ